MSDLPLALKYRPATFRDLVGQRVNAVILQKMVEGDKVPPALLFSGPSGVGKTSAARVLAAALGASDIIEVDAASNGGVDQVRKLLDVARYSTGGAHRVLILDEALALDTPLPTPDGWTTVGAVSPGEFVLGRDGTPVRVLRKTSVFLGEVCYRVTFSDGTSVVASANHKWLTRREYKSQARPAAGFAEIRTTAELARLRTRVFVPRPAAWVNQEKLLPVSPYLLGLWLGDGSKGQNHIHGLRADLEFYAGRLAAEGIETRLYETGKSADRLSFTSPLGPWGAKGGADAQALRQSPVFRNKHIPAEYLRSSVTQREELLRGLMDTDGYVSKTDGFCTFVGTDELTSGVLELLYSLGQTARRHWVSDPRSRQGGYYTVRFKPLGGLVPVALPRKVERVRQSGCSVEWERIRSIEEVSSVPVQCIEVEAEDHLFLAGPSGRVTHNCHSISKQGFEALLKTLEEPPGNTIFVLVTTEAHKIPPTVLSRLIEFQFRTVSDADILDRLVVVAHHEGIAAESALLTHVVRTSRGNVRTALMSLDQLSRAGISTLSDYLSVVGEHDVAPRLLDACSTGDHSKVFSVLDEWLAQQGSPDRVSSELVSCLRDIMVIRSGGVLPRTGEDYEARRRLALMLEHERLLAAMRVLWEVKTKLRSEDPRSMLELALVLISEAFTVGRVTAPVLAPSPEQAPKATRVLSLSDLQRINA